jgi:hypothetical protein
MKLASYPSRRTGPAHVRDCGCDALPWQDCGCHAWDAGLSLDRVIERAQLDMTQYPDETQERRESAGQAQNGRSNEQRQEPHKSAGDAGAARPPLNVLLVLARCRRMAEREMSRGRKHAKEAKRLIADIEAVAQGGLPC